MLYKIINVKKLIITSVVVLFIGLTTFAQSSDATATGFSRDLRFEVSGNYSRPITKEKLTGAKSLNDLIPYYPTNWITDYISVEISATSNGQFIKGISANNILSTEQKNILNAIDLGSDLAINVKYNYLNPVTNIIENNKMNVSMTVVPEKEAECVTGKQQLIKYLKENAIDKISETILEQFQQAVVLFTINENGEINNANIFMTSGDSKTDILLLEVINNMPKWKPAENRKGIKVKQEFKFSVGKGGC